MNGFHSLLALVLSAGSVASGQVHGDRAPIVNGGGAERGSLTLATSDPLWTLSAVRGVPDHPYPLAIPPHIPGQPRQIGVNWIPPAGPVSFGTVGVSTVEGQELVWRVRLDAPGAAAMRLHLAGLDLAPGAKVTVSGNGRGYVTRGRGAMGKGDEWTPVLDGPHAYVEYRGPVNARRPKLSIQEVAEIASPWPAAPVSDLPCQEDVSCHTVDAVARDSVGWMIFSSGTGTFVCTGTLLNDADPLTTTGWLLTARHCVGTAQAAASLSVYWFYQTPSCNGVPPEINTLPVSQGATLLVEDFATDVSFLRLAQDPNAGQGLAGWTGAEPAGTVWSIHHPGSTFKRVASGAPTVLPPICYGVLGLYQYHYVNYTLGLTEDLSGGAPLFNSAWQVVGQLFGSCATATPDCNNPSQWNAVYGRLSRSLPFISSYLTGQTSPARIYVNAAATGLNNGTSWVDAYTSLAAPLGTLAPPTGGTEIWVAKGTYKPGPTRSSAFHLIRGVGLYGGFAGTEANLAERDIPANPTILSGDLAGDDGPNFTNRSDNAYHVVIATAVDQTAVLDGFTIKGGNADGTPSFGDKGAGIYVEAGSPRVHSCTFTDNTAAYSGAAMAYFPLGTANVKDCTFTGNTAMFGGALSMTGCSGTLESCLFQGNSASSDGGAIHLYNSSPDILTSTLKQNTAGARGGGVFLFPFGSPSFQDCRFEQNQAGFGAGGAGAFGGQQEFIRCVFLANSTTLFGGGVLGVGGAQTIMSQCRFLKNTSGDSGGGLHVNSGLAQLTNCEFSGNKSTGAGGGAILHNHDGQVSLLSCTIAQNTAFTTGGGINSDSGAVTITNCIVSGNTDAGGTGESAQVRITGGIATLSYSLVAGLTGSLGGTGNIGGDPLFVAPLGPDLIVGTEDDDLSLGLGSPAVDAGDTQAVLAITTDLRGHIRREDDPCQPDTGTGPAPVVDMGALERTGSGCAPCYVNCDESTANPILNVNDFQCFLNRYATGDSYCNCDGSTAEPILNVNDFQCFLNAYAVGCT